MNRSHPYAMTAASIVAMFISIHADFPIAKTLMGFVSGMCFIIAVSMATLPPPRR